MPQPLPHSTVITIRLIALAQSLRAILVATVVVLTSLWSSAAHFLHPHQVTIEFHGQSHWLRALQSGTHKRTVEAMAIRAAMLLATRQAEVHQQVGPPEQRRRKIFIERQQERSRPFVLPSRWVFVMSHFV